MRKIIKIGLALLALIVIIMGISAAVSPPRTTPKVEVTTALDIYNNTACIKATIQGKKMGLNLYMNDPIGNQVDWTFISEEMMEDGVETKWLALMGPIKGIGETPKGGTYKLLIKDYLNQEVLFEKVFTYDGAKVSITDADFSFKEYGFLGYGLDSLNLTIKNDGDLPAYVAKVEVSIAGKEPISFIGEWILPQESKRIEAKDFMPETFQPGTYPIIIKIRTGALGEGEILATHSLTAEVPS